MNSQMSDAFYTPLPTLRLHEVGMHEPAKTPSARFRLGEKVWYHGGHVPGNINVPWRNRPAIITACYQNGSHLVYDVQAFRKAQLHTSYFTCDNTSGVNIPPKDITWEVLQEIPEMQLTSSLRHFDPFPSHYTRGDLFLIDGSEMPVVLAQTEDMQDVFAQDPTTFVYIRNHDLIHAV